MQTAQFIPAAEMQERFANRAQMMREKNKKKLDE